MNTSTKYELTLTRLIDAPPEKDLSGMGRSGNDEGVVLSTAMAESGTKLMPPDVSTGSLSEAYISVGQTAENNMAGLTGFLFAIWSNHEISR